MSILLTGATGFLGRHVLDALTAQKPGVKVYALVRRASEWHKLDYAASHPEVVPIEGDMVGAETWMDDPRLQSLEGIIHLAAIVKHSRRDPEPLFAANVEGTSRVVRFAGRQSTPVVFVSTSGTVACHRKPDRAVDEDAPYIESTVGSWPYYASKIRAERAARGLAAESGVPLTIIRPPILLGPGDHRFRSTSNIIRYMRKRLPFLIEGGISFCDVRDVASSVVAALGHPARRPVYHMRGHDMSIGAFFDACERVCGIAPPRRFLPYGLARALAGGLEAAFHAVGRHSPLPDPVVVEMARHHWGIGSRHAETELGYSLRDAHETLTDTIAWLEAHHPELAGTRTASGGQKATHA